MENGGQEILETGLEFSRQTMSNRKIKRWGYFVLKTKSFYSYSSGFFPKTVWRWSAYFGYKEAPQGDSAPKILLQGFSGRWEGELWKCRGDSQRKAGPRVNWGSGEVLGPLLCRPCTAVSLLWGAALRVPAALASVTSVVQSSSQAVCILKNYTPGRVHPYNPSTWEALSVRPAWTTQRGSVSENENYWGTPQAVFLKYVSTYRLYLVIFTILGIRITKVL